MSDALTTAQDRAASIEPVAVPRKGQPYEGDNVGRMIITLVPNGTSRPAPHVHFDPVGLFTPGLVGDYTLHFAQEIAAAQARFRHEHRLAAKREAR